MRLGFLEGESSYVLRPCTIQWTDTSTWEEDELAPSPWFVWSKAPKFAGYRCKSCGIIELHLRERPPELSPHP